MGTAPCSDQVALERGSWSAKEDALLINYIQEHGEGHWANVPKKAGLPRCGRSCRLRWLNYLRPGIKRGNFTADEDDLIIRLHSLLGNRWSLIAKRIPGRTDNEIKNYWNSHLTKRLVQKSIAKTDHQPKPSTTDYLKKKNKKKPKKTNPQKYAHLKENTNTDTLLPKAITGVFPFSLSFTTNNHTSDPKASRVFPFSLSMTTNSNGLDGMLNGSPSPPPKNHGEGLTARANDTESLNSLTPSWSEQLLEKPGDEEQILFDDEHEFDISCLDDHLLAKEDYHNMFNRIYEEYQELLSSEDDVNRLDCS